MLIPAPQLLKRP